MADENSDIKEFMKLIDIKPRFSLFGEKNNKQIYNNLKQAFKLRNAILKDMIRSPSCDLSSSDLYRPVIFFYHNFLLFTKRIALVDEKMELVDNIQQEIDLIIKIIGVDDPFLIKNEKYRKEK